AESELERAARNRPRIADDAERALGICTLAHSRQHGTCIAARDRRLAGHVEPISAPLGERFDHQPPPARRAAGPPPPGQGGADLGAPRRAIPPPAPLPPPRSSRRRAGRLLPPA